LIDKKEQSNRYNFEDLFDIYFNICRHCKDSLKDCVESFLLTVLRHRRYTVSLKQSLENIIFEGIFAKSAREEIDVNRSFKNIN
jgi:hypothetical protein